jgi:hypothetical protein
MLISPDSMSEIQKAQKMEDFEQRYNPIEQWAIRELVKALRIAHRALGKNSRGRQASNSYAAVTLLKAYQLFYERLGSMTNTKIVSGKDFKFERWINVRLEDEHKAALQALADEVSFEELMDWIASMAYQGYSFSCAWDDYSDAQQVSLVCKAADDPNFGCGLSARHPDFDLAVLTLRYKHLDMLGGVWNNAPPTPQGNAWG